MKAGISAALLAKICEAFIPVIFIFALWFFVRANFGERLSFFVLLAFSSPFYFYMSLLNNAPATLALTFGLLSVWQLLKGSLLGSCLFLALCFYTHIGISWFFFTAVVIYAFFDRRRLGICVKTAIWALVLAAPVLAKQALCLRFISALGFRIHEKNIFQIKIVDYCLASLGVFFILKKKGYSRVFIALGVASLIFLAYPYRFFSAQGYLPVIFLAGICLDSLYSRIKNERRAAAFVAGVCAFMLFISPSVTKYKSESDNTNHYRIAVFDSALEGMLFARWESIWFPNDYLPASEIIKANSAKDDIVYSSLNLAGVILAAISGRASANALLPEIGASRQFDPYENSKIIIFNRLDEEAMVRAQVGRLRLRKIGETKSFLIYINDNCRVK